MARSIRVHVQVDRLPNIGADKFVQLGLRVSAAIVPDAAGAQDGDHRRILPWLWQNPADLGAAWSIHSPASWKVFHFKPGTGKLSDAIAAADLSFLDPAKAGVNDFDPNVDVEGKPTGNASGTPLFRTRIEAEVGDILKTFGVRRATEAPAQNVITGRTLYGLAESLTSLPNPVPAAMNVWTAVTIEKTKLVDFEEDDVFVAVPELAAAASVYTAPNKPVLASGWTADLMRTGGDAVEAKAHIEASLPLRDLKAGSNPERLIDLSNLLIRAKTTAQFEAEDWTASAGMRIAEAIDPAARAMAVLDETIDKVIRDKGVAIRDALRQDLTGKSPKELFRNALRELHRPIVTPRALRSESATAPAASFLEMLALRSPQLWPSIVPLLFAQGEAEDPATPPRDVAAFHATSSARLLAAAGVLPSPELVTTDALNVPGLDDESRFAAWLGQHWTSFPKTGPVAGMRFFEGSSRLMTRELSKPVGEVFRKTGVVDFSRVPQNTSVSVRFADIQKKPCTATLVWEKPQDSGSSITIKVLFDTAETKVEVDGALQITAAATAEARIVFRVIAGPPPTLAVDYVEKGKDPVPLTIGAAATVLSGRIGLTVHTTEQAGVSIENTGTSPLVVDGERLATQAQALRAALSWAYAAPFVPALLQGWIPIAGETVVDVGSQALAVRLPAAMKAFIQASFKTRFDELAKTISADTTDPLRVLFDGLRDAAIADAGHLAESIVPPPLDQADRLTEDALPLAFLVAQLQDFNEKEDLWGRLGGVGVLISREPEVSSDKWWSLNAASLHIARSGVNGREPLTKKTGVRTRPLTGEDEKLEPWKRESKVDPVPLSVGDVGGIRSALVRYENHSIAGEIEGAPQLDPAGRTSGTRRPEAFLFPPTNFTRMPALTFGRTYAILPYLIGHGGALPPALRADEKNPVVLKPVSGDTLVVRKSDLGSAGAHHVFKRTTTYLRTVPVGAPRLSAANWPGTFPGVEPLADELPLRPAPLTLRKGAETRFFLDRQRVSGTLSRAGDAIRIEIGEIAPPGVNASLEFRVEMRPAGGAVETALKITADIAKMRAHVSAAAPMGLRIDFGHQAEPVVALLRRREGEHADDEAEAIHLTKGAEYTLGADPLIPVSSWDAAYLAVAAVGDAFDFDPPVIRWASVATDKTLLLAGDRPILPPELAHAARKVAILDGIRAGAKTGPPSITLPLRRPATTAATYERWINGPTGAHGSAPDGAIRTLINAGRARASAVGSGDRSFDDPAVQAIFAEVVQLFPRRAARKITAKGVEASAKDGPVLIAEIPSDLAQIAAVAKDPMATVVARLANETKKLLPNASEDARIVGDVADGKLVLDLVPGCTYEIRLYGAVPASQPLFSPDATEKRFSPAVHATWRAVQGMPWHLGTPLTLTIEVATEIMPECWPLKKDGKNVDFGRPAFAIDLARPPAVVEDRALIRLVPEHVGPPVIGGARHKDLRYPALRYVNRAALMNQRWSWRGRPHPEIVFEKPSFGTKGTPIDVGLGQVIDAAFLGRADDDIGAVREVAFHRAHAAGGDPVIHDDLGMKTTKRPVLMEHDLDRRSGTHFWRFGLRLKSRYAAMRPNHPELLRFSHLERGSSLTHWWRFVVPDRVQPARVARALDRPSLMLVLPLTEPLMTDGSVPPLLAVFNQEMFPQFNAADGMEVVVDVARHPFPGNQRIDPERKPDGQAETYGALLDNAWKKVEAARRDADVAQAAAASSHALSSPDGKDEQKAADDALTSARETLATLEAELKVVQAKGAAWGVVKQWDVAKKQVAEALAAAKGDEERKRLRNRLDVEIPAEIEAATKIAEALEKLESKNVATPFGTPANPSTKYFQEIAPDPIREAAIAADRPVAIRVDGPVGYTFDAGAEAGRFDHVALLVSPVAEVVRPWSFVRLRFRRMEVPGLLVAAGKPSPDWPDELPAKLVPEFKELPADGARFLIARSSGGAAAIDTTVHRFETIHDGLVFNVPKVGSSKLTFKLVPPAGDAPCVEEAFPERTTVTTDLKDDTLFVDASTHLGKSARWSLRLSEGAKVQMQIVVSLRPKPASGSAAADQEYVPVGDLSVRIRVTPDDFDPVRRPQDRAWLSVLCMPLTTHVTETRRFRDLVAVRVCPEVASPAMVVQPARVSDFAPAVWCQFAAPMSRFEVRAKTSAQRTIEEVLPVSKLTVVPAADLTTFEIGLDGLRTGETLEWITLRPEGHPETDGGAGSQLEEPLYAIVTQFVYDAFDRLRERAIGIHPVAASGETIALGARVWPAEKDREPYAKNMHGRVRFLRVLRGKLRGQGGFESDRQEFPFDFFGREQEELLDADPPDAAGMAMGISTPIEWKS